MKMRSLGDLDASSFTQSAIITGIAAWVVGNIIFGSARRVRRVVKRYRQKRQGWPKRIKD